jgi:pyruvate,water dikinase
MGFSPVRKALSGEAIDSAMGRAVSDLLSRAEGWLAPAGEAGLPVKYVRKGLVLTIARRVLWAMANPDGAREKTWSTVEAYIRTLSAASRRTQTVAERVQFIHTAVGSALGGIVTRTVPVWVASSVALNMVKRKLTAWGVDTAALEAVGRSIPHNPTTEMDLALWRLSRTLKAEGAAPRADHPAVQAWLQQYGHRAVREIDIAIPRWREEPEHILHVLSSYLEQETGATDPESRFARGAVEADATVAGIVATVRREKGVGRAALVRMLLHRYRKLAGVREWHKFFVIHVFAIIRQTLADAGAELVRAGRLDQAGDVFFLDLDDLTSDRDLRALAAKNRSDYARELKRRTVPLAITSEGEVSYGVPAGKEGTLTGTGASAGTHEGAVRVILNPVGARLEPGEVLVAPGTDPAWTQLFLTAGALVTETGGMISHGSVVAREYGIPAVVGVPEATTLLRTGQRVRVDGSTGTVTVLD